KTRAYCTGPGTMRRKPRRSRETYRVKPYLLASVDPHAENLATCVGCARKIESEFNRGKQNCSRRRDHQFPYIGRVGGKGRAGGPATGMFGCSPQRNREPCLSQPNPQLRRACRNYPQWRCRPSSVPYPEREKDGSSPSPSEGRHSHCSFFRSSPTCRVEKTRD